MINDGGKLISKNEKELAKIKDETKHDAEQVRKLAKEGFELKITPKGLNRVTRFGFNGSNGVWTQPNRNPFNKNLENL